MWTVHSQLLLRLQGFDLEALTVSTFTDRWSFFVAREYYLKRTYFPSIPEALSPLAYPLRYPPPAIICINNNQTNDIQQDPSVTLQIN